MLIETSKGLIDRELLIPFEEIIDNDNERTTVTGYTLNGEVVQRSVHVHLKKGIDLNLLMGDIGNG